MTARASAGIPVLVDRSLAEIADAIDDVAGRVRSSMSILGQDIMIGELRSLAAAVRAAAPSVSQRGER